MEATEGDRVSESTTVHALVTEAVQEAVQAASELNRVKHDDPFHENASAGNSDGDMRSRCNIRGTTDRDVVDKENSQQALHGSDQALNLEVPGQPNATIRLYKAKVRVHAPGFLSGPAMQFRTGLKWTVVALGVGT